MIRAVAESVCPPEPRSCRDHRYMIDRSVENPFYNSARSFEQAPIESSRKEDYTSINLQRKQLEAHIMTTATPALRQYAPGRAMVD